jgi:gas vesicle protein
MSDERDGNASSVILAFLLGGLTGAALAILYTPRTGQETRDLLGEKFREGEGRARAMRERAVARGREVMDHAADYVERQRETIEQQKERLHAAVDAGRQAYREEKSKA